MVYQPVLRQGRFDSTASQALDLDVIYHGTLRTVHQVQAAHVRRWRNSEQSEQAMVEVLVKPVPHDSTN
jgi:Cft2 family RNA processing exonuclease